MDTPNLDLDYVRSQFPAFSQPSLEGWAFFENAGGSYPCAPVVNRLTDFYTQTKVQPYYPYPASIKAGQAMDESYVRLAAMMGVDPDEVDFGPSTSQNTYVLAHALGAAMAPGDEVVVTNQDHEANTGVWRRLASDETVVKEWKVDPETGILDPACLESVITPRTRVVALPHCSNVIAHMNPVAEITKKIKSLNPNALVVVDGVSAAPHGFPNMVELGCDFYLFSLYKTYGPHQGIMIGRRDARAQLGNEGHYFNAAEPHKRLVPAGPDHAQVAAAAGVADYVDGLYIHHFGDTEASPVQRTAAVSRMFAEAESPLLARLLGWLAEREDVTIIGPADAGVRASTVSVVPSAKPVNDVLASLVDHRIMAGDGHFYAVRPLEAIGVDTRTGVLRLSFVHYTSAGEIEQLIAALDACL